jgi:hypothetical protein
MKTPQTARTKITDLGLGLKLFLRRGADVQKLKRFIGKKIDDYGPIDLIEVRYTSGCSCNLIYVSGFSDRSKGCWTKRLDDDGERDTKVSFETLIRFDDYTVAVFMSDRMTAFLVARELGCEDLPRKRRREPLD